MDNLKAAVARKVREKMLDAFAVAQAPDPDQSRERGKQLRAEIPREAHALWEAPEDRPDPVELLRSQEASRVRELIGIRYARMSASAFAFYRGSALIMASDLSCTPVTGIDVQACGDAHICNFGLFNSPERRTVFDINDFDETARGPWEWDVKRLAASVEICGRDRAFSPKKRKAAVLACLAGYREAMRDFAEMGNLDVWYAHADVDTLKGALSAGASKKSLKKADKVLAKAKAKDSARAVEKFTEVEDGQLRIVSDPPIIVPLRDFLCNGGSAPVEFGGADMAELVNRILFEYRNTLSPDKKRLIELYTGVDVARKVVGVGSVGMCAWIVVMRGSNENDPLVLQVKEAQDSVLERFVGKSRYREKGRRVVEGQRAIQMASDMFLGWCHLPDGKGKVRHYYVRQLWDGKGSVDLSRLDSSQLAVLARMCGYTLAHAHARTGDRFAIAGYLGKKDQFDQAIARFAEAYADQNESDYRRFIEAVEAGELAVAPVGD